MLKYCTEKAPSILVLSKSWFLWKCPFFVFWMGRCSPTMSCNFFPTFFVLKLYGLRKIGCARFQSFFPFAQLSKLTSGGRKEYLMVQELLVRFWWDSGRGCGRRDIWWPGLDGLAFFFSIVVLYSSSTVFKRSDEHVFGSFIHPINSQNWLQEVRKETGGSNRGAPPPLEGGFWSKKAQNPIGELFLGGGPA